MYGWRQGSQPTGNSKSYGSKNELHYGEFSSESGSIRLATEMLCLVAGGKKFRYHIGV